MELYPLDSKDIEAIAKSRSNRTMPQNIKYWMYGGLVAVFIGFVYGAFGTGGMLALAIMAGGVISAWYATSLADKRRKYMAGILKQEWREIEKAGGKS